VVQGALIYGYGLRFLAACQRRYGSVFTLRIMSIGALVYLTDPADIKAVCAAEASAAGDPAGDEYLDALVKETLWIRPVVYDVGRVLTKPVELAGYRLPAGVMVAPSIGLVRASAALHPDPDRFDPDRNAWRHPESDLLVAVRRRQQALPGLRFRDGRDAGGCCVRSCAASNCAPRRQPANVRS
jgi:cytochrome P450